MSEKITNPETSLTDTFPYAKAENLAIESTKEQIGIWRKVQIGIAVSTVAAEIATSLHFGINRFATAISHLSTSNFAIGLQEILHSPQQAWNSPETIVAWAGAITLIGLIGVGGSEAVIWHKNKTLGGHRDELETISYLLNRPEMGDSATECITKQASNISSFPYPEPWNTIVKPLLKDVLKPAKTLTSWQNSIYKASKWDDDWEKMPKKLLGQTQASYRRIELATAIQSPEVKCLTPSQAAKNLAKRILNQLGNTEPDKLTDGELHEENSIDTIESATSAIREFTTTSGRTQRLKRDFSYKENVNQPLIEETLTSLTNCIKDAQEVIESLPIEIARVQSEYTLALAMLPNDPEQRKNAKQNADNDKRDALATIEQTRLEQLSFIHETQSAQQSIQSLIDFSKEKFSIDGPDDLLSPYSYEEELQTYFAENS